MSHPDFTTPILLSLLSMVGCASAGATPTYTVTASTIVGHFPNPLGFGSEEFALTGPHVSISGGASDPALTGLSGVSAGVPSQIFLGGNCFAEGCGFGGMIGGVTYGQPGQDVELGDFPLAISSQFEIPAGAVNPTITVAATVGGGTVFSCAQNCGSAGPFDLAILPESGILTVTFDNEVSNPNLYDEVFASFTSVPEPAALPVVGLLLLFGAVLRRAATLLSEQEEASK